MNNGIMTITIPVYGIRNDKIEKASLSNIKEGSVILAIAEKVHLKFALNRALLFANAASAYQHIAADIMNEEIFALDQLQEGEYRFRISCDGAFLGYYEDGSSNDSPETYRAFVIENGKPKYMPLTIEGLKEAEKELAPALEKCFDPDSNDMYVYIDDDSKYLEKEDFDTVMGNICSDYPFDFYELWDKEYVEYDKKGRFGVF